MKTPASFAVRYMKQDVYTGCKCTLCRFVRELLCVFKIINIENTEGWQYSGDWISCRRKIQEGKMSVIFKIIIILRELASYVLAVCNVLTPVALNIKVLCVSTPCLLEDFFILNITTVRSFETSIRAYQLKRRKISEDLNVYCKFSSGLLFIFYKN